MLPIYKFIYMNLSKSRNILGAQYLMCFVFIVSFVSYRFFRKNCLFCTYSYRPSIDRKFHLVGIKELMYRSYNSFLFSKTVEFKINAAIFY